MSNTCVIGIEYNGNILTFNKFLKPKGLMIHLNRHFCNNDSNDNNRVFSQISQTRKFLCIILWIYV